MQNICQHEKLREYEFSFICVKTLDRCVISLYFTVGNHEANDNVTLTDVEKPSNITYQSPDQISSNLITLSLLPESRWKTLLNLDIINVRNIMSFLHISSSTYNDLKIYLFCFTETQQTNRTTPGS